MTNQQVLEAANEAVTQGNNEKFLSYCTDDTQWTFVGEETLYGKNAVRDYMQKTYVKPPEFKVDNLIVDKDAIAAIGVIRLFNKDETYSDYDYCDVWYFKDGKMDKLEAFVVEKNKV